MTSHSATLVGKMSTVVTQYSEKFAPETCSRYLKNQERMGREWERSIFWYLEPLNFDSPYSATLNISCSS